jgi:lipopolysaccharide transport system ATP-binding protein
MIMDDWLSGGDSKFKAKAQERLVELVGSSKIFLMASHSASLQKKMCNKGVVLQNGEITFRGDIDDALKYADGI